MKLHPFSGRVLKLFRKALDTIILCITRKSFVAYVGTILYLQHQASTESESFFAKTSSPVIKSKISYTSQKYSIYLWDNSSKKDWPRTKRLG